MNQLPKPQKIRRRRKRIAYRGGVNQSGFPNHPEPQKRPEKMFNTGIPGICREDMDAYLNRDRT